MQEFETTLSSARLKLLEKRKEIREAVHEHYRDLIGVSDHAANIGDNCDSIHSNFSKVLSLNEELMARSTSRTLQPIVASVPPPSPPIAPDVREGQILFSLMKHDFRSVLSIVQKSLHPPSSIPRIDRYCVLGMSSASLDEVESLHDCLSLLTLVSPVDSLSDRFWAARSELLRSLSQLGLLMLRHFELSLCLARDKGWAVPAGFLSEFGGSDGLVAASLFTVFHHFSKLPQLVSEYHRVASSSDYSDETQTVLLSAARRVGELCVRTAVADDTDIDFSRGIDLSRMDQDIGSLLVSLDSFPLLDTSPECVVGAELSKRILQVCHESEYSMEIGIRSGQLCAAIRGEHAMRDHENIPPIVAIDYVDYCPNLVRMNGFLDSAVSALETLSETCFDQYWENRVKNWKYIPVSPICRPGTVVVQSTTITIPTGPSPRLFELCLRISQELATVPSYLDAACYAKKYFARQMFHDHSTDTMNFQTLFDLHFITIFVSHVNDTDKSLSEKLATVEKIVLADAVDWLLYRDIIRVSAMESVARCSTLLHPLVCRSNPLYTYSVEHIRRRGHPEITLVPSQDMTTVEAIDRFDVLPVSRAKPAVPKKQPATGGFNTNSVTSFFNQVGRITLGSNK
jgi:hypothetical protein